MSITNNQGSKKDLETSQLVQEYLENGGAVTKCKAYATTPDIETTHGWGKRKPQPKNKE